MHIAVNPVNVFIWLALSVLIVVSWWRVFEKAGHPGWAAIIPIYNTIILLEIADRPGWWVILMFGLFLNLVIIIIMSLGVADSFGRSAGFGVGLAFLPFIFYPILAFTD